jgi:hypothetical protein
LGNQVSETLWEGGTVPDKEQLNLVVGRSAADLRAIRLPGLEKPFEELTISELVQLRPGSEVADTYEVNAVTDNISATTSSILAELGNIQRDRVRGTILDQTRLDGLRAQLGPALSVGGTFQRSSAEPQPNEVRLGPSSDPFNADAGDPFIA